MALSFAAILPHSPLLVPSIGKENRQTLEKTLRAIEQTQEKIAQAAPQTCIIISPHTKNAGNAFLINIHPAYTSHFSEFGDFTKLQESFADIPLLHEIQKLHSEDTPVNVTSNVEIDYGTSIPLELVFKPGNRPKIAPLSSSTLSLEQHFLFGKKIQEVILNSPQKIAIIASADLSHRLTEGAPGGYSAKAKRFDTLIKKIIKEKSYEEIKNLSESLLSEAGECGSKPLAILFGMIDGINHENKILSYEYPFGVGHIVSWFEVS